MQIGFWSVSQMAYHDHKLSGLFHALGDPTRIAVVELLSRREATISELAAPHDMALSSFLKHVAILEQSGLITTVKKGRVRTAALVPAMLGDAEKWFRDRRGLWEGRLDRLDAFLKHKEPHT
jgi:DNA-binding transcriptional ArsR family regulator